jgi:hypothetical protein
VVAEKKVMPRLLLDIMVPLLEDDMSPIVIEVILAAFPKGGVEGADWSFDLDGVFDMALVFELEIAGQGGGVAFAGDEALRGMCRCEPAPAALSSSNRFG